MNYRIITSIFALFSIISIAMIWHSKNLQQNVVETSGLYNAKLYSDAISVFRSIYTSEVISAAKQHGLQVTHDYKNKKAIPLPATLGILLGNTIGESGSGERVSLYSPYPFPWREKTGGLKDNFRKKAWSQLSNNSDTPYYEFHIENNKNFLRYAVADEMSAGCVSCHNSYPGTPKSDWKVGDVRGILEITLPLDKVIKQTDDDLMLTIVIYSALAMLGIAGIIFIMSKHKEESNTLEKAVRQRTVELELEKEKAIKANQAKTEFLSNMSHELRTPLNAILGFGQLLEMNVNTDLEKENCKEILVAGNHLLHLVNEVLDLEKIEAGTLSVNIEPVSVDNVINDSLKLFTSIAENKNVHIDDYIPTNFYVYADQSRIKQVMLNLISNAIKYNRNGGNVTINATCNTPNTVRISVTDTGHGLNEKQKQHLFTPFDKVVAENSGIDGVGIGLAISQQLIKLMNGKIGLQSIPNKGSTFWIEFNSITGDKNGN